MWEPSQSPQFGSRCFVLSGLPETPVGGVPVRELSQSPQFGSRCFVPAPGRQIQRPGTGTSTLPAGRVAIPSVRVSVFRRGRSQSCPPLPEIHTEGRNPLSSGLGVSSRTYLVASRGHARLSQSPQFGSRCFVLQNSTFLGSDPKL